jgi:hypothetical protein
MGHHAHRRGSEVNMAQAIYWSLKDRRGVQRDRFEKRLQYWQILDREGQGSPVYHSSIPPDGKNRIF